MIDARPRSHALGVALVCLTLPACGGAGSARSTVALETRTRADVYRGGLDHGGGGSGDAASSWDEEPASYGGSAGGGRGPSIEIDLAAESSLSGVASAYAEPEMEASSDDDRDRRASRALELPERERELAERLSEAGEAYTDASGAMATAGEVGSAAADTATDAIEAGPLLIYTAGIWLAVYEVRESEDTIIARAEELGGFVQHQTDGELVVRVPGPQFEALVLAVTGVGDLLHREIAADDVSEEYHDVEIRIRNLEAMRERLEVLLTQATAVEDALRVERELERVTVELERLRGRQRFLDDRIAFATITVHFEARPRDRIDQPEIFALPFYWLQNLGLPRLLDLH